MHGWVKFPKFDSKGIIGLLLIHISDIKFAATSDARTTLIKLQSGDVFESPLSVEEISRIVERSAHACSFNAQKDSDCLDDDDFPDHVGANDDSLEAVEIVDVRDSVRNLPDNDETFFNESFKIRNFIDSVGFEPLPPLTEIVSVTEGRDPKNQWGITVTFSSGNVIGLKEIIAAERVVSMIVTPDTPLTEIRLALAKFNELNSQRS